LLAFLDPEEALFCLADSLLCDELSAGRERFILFDSDLLLEPSALAFPDPGSLSTGRPCLGVGRIPDCLESSALCEDLSSGLDLFILDDSALLEDSS
jgi:hypothetical protein